MFSLSIYHSHHKGRGIGLQSAANYRDQDIIRQVPLLQLLKDALEPYRGLPPETYIIGLGTQPVTAPWYHRHWAEFWRKHEQAHPITRTYTRVRNGKQYTYHQTDWVADVCAHQFHHEYVAGAPNEIAMQAGGPCKSKNDPRSVPALESKYDRQCRKADQ